MIPSAFIRSRFGTFLFVLTMLVVLLWTARHVITLFQYNGLSTGSLTLIWIALLGILVFHLLLAWTSKPFVVNASQEARLDRMKVGVIIPAYNEDPQALALAIESLFRQTRLPQYIHVVDDGSTNDMEFAKIALYALADEHPEVQVYWTRTVNQGKRHAQIKAIHKMWDADVYVTMDSDTVLDSKCIREGMKPFRQRKVTSVAGLTLTYNSRHPFVRMTDSWILSFQLVARSALSRLGNVLVNSGGFSMYRGDVVREALDSYANETFMGQTVMFSDDSLLTLFAKLKGKTVQQESSVAFTFMPEKPSHHVRQQLRWMRGSTIRSVWRFRYLPIMSWGYWENFINWVSYVIVTAAFGYLLFYVPIVHGEFIPYLFIFSTAVAYMNAARYLIIGRTDQSLWFQIGTVALAPVMMIWVAIVLRFVRLYAIVTCWKTGWGTRSQVEVEVTPELVTV